MCKVLESAPIPHGTPLLPVANLLLQHLPFPLQTLLAPFVQARVGEREGEGRLLLVEFAKSVRQALEKTPAVLRLDPLHQSPILNLSEASSLISQFFVDYPGEWANVVSHFFQHLALLLLDDPQNASKFSQELLQNVGETLLEQINSPIVASQVAETLQHNAFVLQVGNDAGMNKKRKQVSIKTEV